MKNWRIYLIVLYVFIPTWLYGQKNKSQELVILLNSGEFFKSKRLHQQICDTISPEIDLYYKFRMAQLMNKDDSAAIYLEKIFVDYPELFGSETINVYGILFDTYAHLNSYDKGVYTYDRMMQHLKENPYGIDEKELKLWKEGTENRLRYLKEITSQPPITLKRRNTNEFAKIKGEESLLFETKINGITRNTVFDTGCDFYYIMNRKEAETRGIKCSISEMSKGPINGEETLIKKVIIDSIEVGNITLYNIPTTIFENDISVYVPDSVKNNPEIMAHVDSTYSTFTNSVIGLPAMKLIGKFLIDYENKKVTFPKSDVQLSSQKDPNIFLYDFNLYSRLKLNGKEFLGMVDTGLDSYIRVDTSFHEKYAKEILIDTTTIQEPHHMITANRIWNDVPYKIIYKPVILFNNKRMQPAKGTVRIYSLYPMWYGEYFDGVIGYDFFRRVGKKVLLDLDNMRFEAIK